MGHTLDSKHISLILEAFYLERKHWLSYPEIGLCKVKSTCRWRGIETKAVIAENTAAAFGTADQLLFPGSLQRKEE